MRNADGLQVLAALVDAHAKPDPNTGRREPIWFFRFDQGVNLQHHGFGGTPPEVDEPILEELQGQGLLGIESGQHDWKLTPTRQGRELVEHMRRVESDEPTAATGEIEDAVIAQAEADNKLGWPAVRPVLLGMRNYWEASGFPRHGIQLAALANALPDDHRPLFIATIRSLIAGDYLRPTTELSIVDLGVPTEVELTDRARAVIDGWPGAAPEELFENLLAVLAAQEASETDPVRKNRLRQLGETVKELGVQVSGEVLAKVLMGGG